MGFSYRKSLKAGPFRITASKSGISYSAGVKGIRMTKRANGRVQTTLSAPGTGLRYTTGGSKRASRHATKPSAPKAPASPSKAQLKAVQREDEAARQGIYQTSLEGLLEGVTGDELRAMLHPLGITDPKLFQAVTDAEQQIAREGRWHVAAQQRAQQAAFHEVLAHQAAEQLRNGVPYFRVIGWLKRQHHIQLAYRLDIMNRANKIRKGKA